MQYSVEFIKGKAFFGPSLSQQKVQQRVQELLENKEIKERGVTYFVDLSNPHELDEPFTENYNTENYINFPIKTGAVPSDPLLFAKLILNLCDKIRKGGILYIYRRDGRDGRDGCAELVAASLLCQYYGISPDESLVLISHYRGKTINNGEELSKIQSDYVRRFFEPIIYGKSLKEFSDFAKLERTVFESDNSTDSLNTVLKALKNDYSSTSVEHFILNRNLEKNPKTRILLMSTLLRPIRYSEQKKVKLDQLLMSIRAELLQKM